MTEHPLLMPTFWKQPAFWGITYRQLSLVVLLYFLFALFYNVALSINNYQWEDLPFLTFLGNNFVRTNLDYLLKLLCTAPIWYLLFYRLSSRPLSQRLLMHSILLPLYVATWQSIYYLISDWLQIGRLGGSGSIWDTYITMLFYCIQFGFFHAYAYYMNYQKQREEEAKLRELALQSELSALKAQLNPHFLYNVFNTISASVPPELEHTREMLAELADLFRYQLKASRSERVLLRDELEFVQKYLALEKARFGDRLRIRYAVSDEVLDEPIAPMLLQPLLENAVKHGISPLIEGGDILLRISRQGDRLQFHIADTGKGLNGHRHRLYDGVGLNNTRLRIEKMYGQQLRIMENEPRGLIVAFDIPIQ